MKKREWLGLLVVSFCLASCGDRDENEPTALSEDTPPPPPPCELILGWDPWEPYQYEIAGGQVFGLDVDIISAMAYEANCELAFRKGTWRDLLVLLERGEIDLLGGATQTPEREEFAWFTRPYRTETFLLYLQADRLELYETKHLEQLLEEGFSVGVVQDYLYPEPIAGFQDSSAFADQFEYGGMSETNVARLLVGEVDGVIEDRFVGDSIIRHKGLEASIVPHPLRFESTPVRVMVSRASVDESRFERLDAGLQRLLESGAVDKILAQYGRP